METVIQNEQIEWKAIYQHINKQALKFKIPQERTN